MAVSGTGRQRRLQNGDLECGHDGRQANPPGWEQRPEGYCGPHSRWCPRRWCRSCCRGASARPGSRTRRPRSRNAWRPASLWQSRSPPDRASTTSPISRPRSPTSRGRAEAVTRCSLGYNASGLLIQNSWGDWVGQRRIRPAVVAGRGERRPRGDIIDGFAVGTAQRSGLRTRRQVNGTTAAFTFGTAGEVPLVGDWNADRISTPGVFHDGRFSLRNQNTGGAADITFTYGNVGDILVVGD
jgi:hypothetical protein